MININMNINPIQVFQLNLILKLNSNLDNKYFKNQHHLINLLFLQMENQYFYILLMVYFFHYIISWLDCLNFVYLLKLH